MDKEFYDNNAYMQIAPGEYVPIGVQTDTKDEYLPDGIYYVRSRFPGHRSITSVPYLGSLYKLGDSKSLDVFTLCGLEDLYDRFTDSEEWRELCAKGSWCPSDLIRLCIKKLTIDFPLEDNQLTEQS